MPGRERVYVHAPTPIALIFVIGPGAERELSEQMRSIATVKMGEASRHPLRRFPARLPVGIGGGR